MQVIFPSRFRPAVSARHDASREEQSTVIPSGLLPFIWRVSAFHQLWLALLSTAVFAAGIVPLELQRRIVNDAFAGGTIGQIIGLAVAYVGVALGSGLLKLGMNVYRGYVSESVVLWLRVALLNRFCSIPPECRVPETEGVEISLILDEAEPIGSFVGVSVSEPLLGGGILVSVFAYMAYLQPWMALVAFAVFSPQFVFVPIMQGAINRRVGQRIVILRRVSIGIIAEPDGGAAEGSIQGERLVDAFSLNMGIFTLKFSMNFLMNFMHHLGIAATLGLGGYYVLKGETEFGTIVAFISGLAQINDPWGDLVSWFRDLRVTATKYDLIVKATEALNSTAPQ
ncbi:ABC transporter transmembrane protein [Chelatococcus asaccharovorans]|nr:ABC transporter transmembrane protein [Chelatococcus asaccharovorans]CAH1683991.1 ABC transporter transmembrane protein [Chelatococcus asaccharovorans]